MNATLTVHSSVQTAVIGLAIRLLAIGLHFIPYLINIHSSKSKLISSSLLVIILLTTKYLDYPISKVIDEMTPLSIAHQNIDNTAKTLIWISFAAVITSSLNYFVWEDNVLAPLICYHSEK